MQGVVLTALVGGTTAFVALDKTVTVAVDGQVREVRSFSRTVGDVLEHEGIAVGPHDVVAPRPDSPLGDGQRVSVRFGRQLTLTIDGKKQTVWVTARTVDEALDQLGLRADGAYLSASRSRAIGRDGLALELRTPKKVTLLLRGKRRTVSSTAPTVASLLSGAKVAVTRFDRVSPSPRTPLEDGQTVRVDRVRYVKRVREIAVPFATLRRQTDDLYEGQSRETRDGDNGLRRLTYRVTLVNGKVTGAKLVDKDYESPVSRVVLVGTASRPAPERETERASRSSSRSSESAPAPSSDGLNWAALAECESGGNPSAVNPAGYYGLYQFSLSTWASVGGSGNPADASVSEQTMRAQILYDRAGAGQWPVCGAYL